MISTWFQANSRASHWLSMPFRVMTAEEDRPGYPRWKQFGIDVLSWLIFLLLVPPENRLVRIWQSIDWRAINRVCAPCYGNRRLGQRAWAPAQMFALLILFFILPARSESELVRWVAIVPVYRWFCGFGVFSPVPDHSSIHTFRKRLGPERFAAILTWLVQRCLDLGLVDNQLVHFDMTGVAASAHLWTPRERVIVLAYALIRYLEQSEPGSTHPESWAEAWHQLAVEVAMEVVNNKALQANPKAPQRLLKSLERWTHRADAKHPPLWEMAVEEAVQTLLAEDLPRQPQAAEAHRRCLESIAERLKCLMPHARGDRDARVGWVSDIRLMCGYWLGFAVDSLHGVITAVKVVPLNADQRAHLLPALEMHRTQCGAYPKAVAADSAQDYYVVHQGLDQRQIQGHIASRGHRGVGGGFPPQRFTWDDQGQLRCPEGQRLCAGKPRQDGLVPMSGTDCALCRRKTDCLPQGQRPDGPRVIHLDPVAHKRWLKNREHTRSEEYKQAQAQRFASEGIFGLVKRLHGAAKMPYRSLVMNQVAGLMIAIARNVTLIAALGKSSDAAM